MQQYDYPPQERLMYIALCDPKYAKKLREQTDFVAVHKYKDMGYGFICDQLGKSEFGLLSSSTTITRFIEDPTFTGRVELREYIYGDGTELSQSKCDKLIHIWDYEKHDIIPLTSEHFSEGEREIGAVVSDFDIVRYIMRKKKVSQSETEEQTPLADTGNRTDLGSGGLRDINPENGRCDLLPASAINQYMSNTGLITRPQDSKRPSLVTAFHYIMQFMDWGDKQFLNEALTCIQTYHWYKDKTYSEGSPIKQDLIFAKAMMDLSVHYKNGALKYAERNWEKGLPVHSFIDSAIRHLCKEMLGWDDEPHDIAVMWNLYGAIWTLQHYPHLNDLPNYKDYRKENGNEVKEEANSGGNTSENFVEEEDIEEDNTEKFLRAKRKPHPETCFG